MLVTRQILIAAKFPISAQKSIVVDALPIAVPERRPPPWLTLDRPGSRRATCNSRTSRLDMSCGTNRI